MPVVSTFASFSLSATDVSPGTDTVKVATTLVERGASSRRRKLLLCLADSLLLDESSKVTSMELSSTPDTLEKAVMKMSSSATACEAFMPENVMSTETDAERLGVIVGRALGSKVGTLDGIAVGPEVDGAEVGCGELKTTRGADTAAVTVPAKRAAAPWAAADCATAVSTSVVSTVSRIAERTDDVSPGSDTAKVAMTPLLARRRRILRASAAS